MKTWIITLASLFTTGSLAAASAIEMRFTDIGGWHYSKMASADQDNNGGADGTYTTTTSEGLDVTVRQFNQTAGHLNLSSAKQPWHNLLLAGDKSATPLHENIVKHAGHFFYIVDYTFDDGTTTPGYQTLLAFESGGKIYSFRYSTGQGAFYAHLEAVHALFTGLEGLATK